MMNFTTASDSDIVSELCRRIKEARLAMQLSQVELAERAQVDIVDIRRIEMGEFVTLGTLIAVLRGLDSLHQLERVLLSHEIRASGIQTGR